MNKLESTVIRQQVRAQQELIRNPEGIRDLFDDIQGEILTLDSLPEQTEEIISRSTAKAKKYASIPKDRHNFGRVEKLLQTTLALDSDPGETEGLLIPSQGYTGGIIVDPDGSQGISIFGFGDLDTLDKDPIQKEMGDTFYPAMMWVKAIRAELGRGLVPNPLGLDVNQQLADLGLSQGSEYESGDLIGATGKMPSEKGWEIINREQDLAAHALEEDDEAFRMSGWADLVTVNPFGPHHPVDTARTVINRGGSLN